MNIPIDRVVAWLGPIIATVSASVATILVAQVNVLGIPGLDKANVATWIAGAITFIVVAGLHALGGLKWLHGQHIILGAQQHAAPPAAPPPQP